GKHQSIQGIDRTPAVPGHRFVQQQALPPKFKFTLQITDDLRNWGFLQYSREGDMGFPENASPDKSPGSRDFISYEQFYASNVR
ncbi:MAG: hypothetical protein LBT65_00270, partial [Synergistaceae bacterium]|nr:hypothetical protein [Synergistaceae bacterium]